MKKKKKQTKTNKKLQNSQWYKFWSHQYQEEEQMEKDVTELRQKAGNWESEITENYMLRDKNMLSVTNT